MKVEFIDGEKRDFSKATRAQVLERVVKLTYEKSNGKEVFVAFVPIHQVKVIKP